MEGNRSFTEVGDWFLFGLKAFNLINLTDLKPGKHKVEVVIDQGEKEGNSFSAWNVSGVLVGEWEK